MFARGRQPRESYKALCLKIDPALVCRQKYASAGLHGYIVYRGEQALTSANSSEEAWSKAYDKLITATEVEER